MGCEVHPCLVLGQGEGSFPALKNNDYGEKFAVFLSHKIDIVTLKLFGFLVSVLKINSVKFSNNNLCIEEVGEIRKILQKDGKYMVIIDSIATLFFEWNPILDYENRKQFFLGLCKANIENLILRECKLGDEITKQVIAKIKSFPEQKIKSLDLYGNELTVESQETICNFVEETKTLQFLGLSKNKFGEEGFVTQILNCIGEIPLSEEQYEEHKAKEKARDEVLEKNKTKKKGAPDEPVPFVFDVKQTENGRFYVKNTSIKILNISNNGIKDGSMGSIRSFAENQGKNVELFIEGNKFNKKTKETLKFFGNLII